MVTDSSRPGQTLRAMMPEAIAADEALVKENRRVKVDEIATSMDIHRGSAHHIDRSAVQHNFK